MQSVAPGPWVLDSELWRERVRNEVRGVNFASSGRSRYAMRDAMCNYHSPSNRETHARTFIVSSRGVNPYTSFGTTRNQPFPELGSSRRPQTTIGVPSLGTPIKDPSFTTEFARSFMLPQPQEDYLATVRLLNGHSPQSSPMNTGRSWCPPK